MRNTKLAILFYFLIFLYLLFFTLNFNYVEGDDAATVLYHLCGRNPQIQEPYAPYNSGMDFLLQCSGLTTEGGLRTFAVLISFISGFLILAFSAVLLELLFEDTALVRPRRRFYFYLLLPFLLPDLIFHSLIINASNVSFAFLLASLVFFVKYLKGENTKSLVLSTLLFAVSIPFRWTTLIALPLYAGLFLYFHPFGNYPREIWREAFKVAAANIVGTILAFLLIWLTGYDLNDMYATVTSTTGYMEKSEVSALSLLASGTAFLTPALLLLVLLGFFQIYRWSQWGWIKWISVLGFLAMSISPFVLLGFYPLYKYSMTLLPLLSLLMLFGFNLLKEHKILNGLFIAAAVIPWIVGIQIKASGTFCGPGFELNTSKVAAANMQSGKNPDSRVKIEKINPVFDSGLYMPMPEGPRPLYGYAYVLFGGAWKNQIDLFTQEREKLFDFLMQHPNAEYFQDRMSSYFSCDLYRKGFKTDTDFLEDEDGAYREFSNGNNKVSIRIVKGGNKSAWMAGYLKTAKHPVAFRSSYSNDILKLATTADVKILGPFTAIKEQP